MVVDAVPASLSNEHVKLAPLSSRRSRRSNRPLAVPNLTGGGTTAALAPSSGAPSRYHVTPGAGFPPADRHVNRMCSDSRGSRDDDAFVDTVGVPGITASHWEQNRRVPKIIINCAINLSAFR